MTQLEVFMVGQVKQGWGPIASMALLASEAFEAPLRVIDERDSYGRAFNARALVPRRRYRNGRHALLIAGVPGQLRGVLEKPLWRGEYESVNVWVIDSFWNNRVPRLLQRTKLLDRVWVADEADVSDWDRMYPGAVGVLPWGTDALAAASRSCTSKDLDVLRVGRQPDALDDDAVISAAAAEVGLRFHGRPPFGASVGESQTNLERALDRARTVLAFTNLVDSTTYTHPTKEYVTGRWTDALAHGAVPAGRRPMTPTAQHLVPDGLHYEIPYTDGREAMRALAEHVRNAEPGLADRARKHALEKLDWRHRFAVIERDLGLAPSEPLWGDLARICTLVDGANGSQNSHGNVANTDER